MAKKTNYFKRHPRRKPYRHRRRFTRFHGLLAAIAVITFGTVYWGLGQWEISQRIQIGDAVNITFGKCHNGSGFNCVIDGDTFRIHGQSIRVADIDTPETYKPRCADEAKLGAMATARIMALLNEGPFTLEPVPGRDHDRYDRLLRIVVRDGVSLGSILVSEGLARPWAGRRLPWC